MRPGWIYVGLLLAGCSTSPDPIVSTSIAPTTVIAFEPVKYQDWGSQFADAACAGGLVRFEGSGFEGSHHVAFWLQGAGQSFFPGRLENGRVPGGVLLGEGDVVDGKVSFTHTFGPSIGPTESGGTMALTPGGSYGRILVVDGAFASYAAFTLADRPCLATSAAPRLTLAPATACPGAALTITGDGFIPGPITLQLWKLYQPAPGELNTGKAPPQERALGEATADAAGHFSFSWTADVEKGGKYTLRALDNGRTRLTTLEVPVCP